MNMESPIVGIDLGTTNSAVAVCRDGRIEIVEQNGDTLVPSYVGLTPDNRLLVGMEARNQYVLYPDRTIRSVKRLMGTEEKLPLGDRTYSPQEVSAMILMELKQRAETFLGTPVSKAVITVPAYFNDAQRQATREAGAIAGLDVLRIINEPTAACLAYETRDRNDVHTVMAFDFGGGTFDVSIVKIQEDVVEVIASHGDTKLGGDDIDEVIFERLVSGILDENDSSAALSDVAANRLRRAAEEAKIRLSNEPYVRLFEDNIETSDGRRLHVEREISREELEEWIAELISRTLVSVRHAMGEAKCTPSDIDEIVLVGGSTRIPVVADVLYDELGKKARRDLHPELAVVYGAGVMASRLMGENAQRILIDITPYTFGTSAMGFVNGEYCPYLYCPVIAAGTPLPVTRTEVFYTMFEGQSRVEVSVFEGESPDARNNALIGKFMVEGLDPNAPENSPILIAMSLDLDGILRVTATEKNTGLSKDIVIERALKKMSEEEIAEAGRDVLRMSDFGSVGMGTGSEQPGAPAAGDDDGKDEFREARRLLRRLHRAKEKMDDVDRQDADDLEKRLGGAIENEDPDAVAELMTEVEDLLFYVESGE